jgi:hypothetical protein
VAELVEGTRLIRNRLEKVEPPPSPPENRSGSAGTENHGAGQAAPPLEPEKKKRGIKWT